MNAHPITIHLLARVGDSEVLNELATVEQVLEAEEIQGDARQPGDAREATMRVTLDMVGALRATAAEIETALQRADLIERMREAYTEAWEREHERLRAQPAAEPAPEHTRSRAGILAALDVLEGRA